MRAIVLMPVLVLAVSAGHAEMGFAQGLTTEALPTEGLPGQAMTTGRVKLAAVYGVAYGAPGNQPNYAPNGGRPDVTYPGRAAAEDPTLTPLQRAAAALAALKIPGFTTDPDPAANQAPMPTISSVAPPTADGKPYPGPVPALSSVPMPAMIGLNGTTAHPVFPRSAHSTKITGLPLGFTNNMGGMPSTPIVNQTGLPPLAQPREPAAALPAPPPVESPMIQSVIYGAPAPVYQGPPTAAAAPAPAYRAAPPLNPAVTYRAPAYAAPQVQNPAPVAYRPAAQMSYAVPAADPAACAPPAVQAAPVAYMIPPQRAGAPDRRLVTSGPGFTVVAPPAGVPFPNAGYIEPGPMTARPVAAQPAGRSPSRRPASHANQANGDPWAVAPQSR